MGATASGALAGCAGCESDFLEASQQAPTLPLMGPAMKHAADEEVVVRPGGMSKLVFIEMGASTASGASTNDGASSASDAGRPRTTTMSMFMTRGPAVLTAPPISPICSKLGKFRAFLHNAGVDTSSWGRDGKKTVEHLFWETYEQRGCILAIDKDGSLKRVTQLVKVKLLAEIYGVDHVLFSRMQFMQDGHIVERKQLPLTKLGWTIGEEATVLEMSDMFCDEECPMTESWKSGCKRTLEDRLGLTPSWQSKNLIEDLEGYKYSVEADRGSDGFPGLSTTYCIYEVSFRVRDPECPSALTIGLPQGQEFATAEGDCNSNKKQDDGGLAIGTQLNIWTWMREESVKGLLSSENALNSSRLEAFRSEARHSAGTKPHASEESNVGPLPSMMVPGGSMEIGAMRTNSTTITGATVVTSMLGDEAAGRPDAFLVRRVPLPQGMSSGRRNRPKLSLLSKGSEPLSPKTGPPNGELRAAMKDKKTDWTLAKSIAKNILNPSYSLQQYYDDLKAFPELDLYLLEDLTGAGTAAGATPKTTGSGRSSGAEYQRTVGAFFAIYWLCRIDIDGMDGFCNGVDEKWRPFLIRDAHDFRVMFPDKRRAFKAGALWHMFRQLLLDAGVLEERMQRGGVLMSRTEKKTTVVNESRLVALLALTAIHDIMKMSLLLPQVQEQHAPYRGFSAGDTIGDHDQALAYVMEYYPELLPSFRDLNAEEKRVLMFTQCNLCFNHGWFVQAEAPPGAIFTKFRETLIRDHKLEINQRDVALYFVHWVTDLAGAEPTPLAGCEKFATKFPLPVLNSFLRSFETVSHIVSETETQVVEEYLKLRWREAVPPAGPPPTGPCAVAKMRLLCMAQSNAGAILEGFDSIPDEDRETLSVEMSRTGCVGQSFSAELSPSEAGQEGPAFLIYYGPAFLQGLGTDVPGARLGVLAEIFRAAREMWPACIAKVSTNVTIRIDMLKALSVPSILEFAQKGDLWVLMKHNDLEAFVERSSKKKLNRMISGGQAFQVLDFSMVYRYSDDSTKFGTGP
mmetsp:Transcript_92809/g.267996  ORF Transcript_92809/g.267996 Transcript_92809/m.267996 type:complete len:1023 (+) Transcript_92809:123-3191(+)